jgi:hypothetical protein
MNTGKEPMRTVRAVNELPTQVQPARDLWPGIESRLAAPQAVSRPRRKGWLLWVPPLALAASVALVAIGIWIGAQVQSPAQPAAAGNAGALIRTALMEPGYVRQREQLLHALPAKLKQLPPESQQLVSESLLSIQRAMQNIESELGRDSSNVLLQELLISSCQEEMRVLTAVGNAEGMDGRI